MKQLYRYLILLAGAYLLLILDLEVNRKKYQPIRDRNYIQINRFLGTWFNYDSFEFIAVSTRSAELLEKAHRQSRPGYALCGTLLGYSVYWITTPLHSLMDRELDQVLATRFPSMPPEKRRLWFCHYIGFILLNIAIMMVSLWLFEKILLLATGPWKHSPWLLNSLLLLLCCNQLTKFFLWVPHTQLFNILTPLLCIYIAFRFPSMLRKFPRSLLFSFCMGLMLLFYGNFLLVLPPMIVTCFLNDRQNAPSAPTWRTARLLGIIACFFLPLLGWMAFLQHRGISFESSELRNFRQFVWILDALAISPATLGLAFRENSLAFFQTLGSLLFPAGLLLYILLFIKASPAERFWIQYRIPLLVFIEVLVFFWLLGYNADRLSFTISVPLYCMVALLLNNRTVSRTHTILITGLILGWILVNLLTHPTHFTSKYFS